MPRHAISASDAATVGPHSHAIGAGDLVFVSGQTPTDPASNRLVAADARAQRDLCLRNRLRVLAAARLTADGHRVAQGDRTWM